MRSPFALSPMDNILRYVNGMDAANNILRYVIWWGVGVVAFLSVAGCISKNAAVDPATVSFVEGVTTRRDVVAAWGNPDSIHGNIWAWKDYRTIGGKGKLGYMGVGFTVSNTQMATYEYRLTFDDRGILRNQTIRSAMHDEPEWSLDPN